MSMFKAVCELCDVASVVIYCPTDYTIMLTLESAINEYWIPSTKVVPGSSWERPISKDIQEIFGFVIPFNKILRLHKLWLPNHKYPYLHHCVFELHVTADQKRKSKSAFGRYRGKIRWAGEDEIAKFSTSNNLKSPELIEYISITKNGNSPPNTNLASEYVIFGNFMEIAEDIIVSGKQTIYEQIVEASGLERGAQEALYREFLLMCYPANYMSFQVFSRFLVDAGWPKEETAALFRSADVSGRNGISFREFLYFIAAVEPGTSHGGGPAELRCRYIFRYFDSDRNNLLKTEEFRNFIVTVRKVKKQPLDAAKVDKEVSDSYKSMGFAETHALTMSDFLKAVGELKLRGTSQIYRASLSIQNDKDNKAKAKLSSSSRHSMLVNITGKTSASYSKGPEYELAIHTIKIQKSGTALNVDQLWNLDNAVSFSSTRQPIINEMVRRISVDQFSQHSQSNELLKALRYLSQINKKMQAYSKSDSTQFSWGQLDSTVIAKHLITVCGQVKDLFVKESRLLDLSSPVYVMGIKFLLQYNTSIHQNGQS